MGTGRGDFQQSWELPRIAIDGPFGTASEVSSSNSVAIIHLYLYAYMYMCTCVHVYSIMSILVS